MDPTLPRGKSMPVQERMVQKFSADKLGIITERLRMMGQSEGVCFSFQGKIGNTRDAHRLSQLAKTKGADVQSKLMAALMHSYFEGSGDVTSPDTLLDAAQKAGLDRAEARAWLDEGKGGDEVDKAVEWAYAKGIQGVPHFIINDRYEIGGAQDVEMFLGEFLRAKSAA